WVYNGKADAYANPLSDDDWQRLAKVKDLTPGEMTAESYDDNYLDDEDADWTATGQGQKSAGDTSKITPVTAIKVTPTGTVEKGKTTTLTVTVEPENATDKTFRAISADPSKATISVKDMTITVTGVKDGKVSIPVISGNGQFAAVAEITVNNVPGG
ncbi:phage tail tube protein, partial [Escherichia coli]|uniref:phage tail tube protein n=1 Tax=Escherichia coli TaxID=562 RepID=UPI002074BA0D